MAHGYLLASFLSPLTNQRTDAYRRSTSRAACAFRSRCWRPCAPNGRPTSPCRCAFRLPIGPSADSPRRICSPSRAHSRPPGSISSTSPPGRPSPGRSRCTAACGRRRSPTRFATRSASPPWRSGNIYEPDHVNSIIASGRADLCAIARPHLSNPAWTLEAAAQHRLSAAMVAAAVSLGEKPARAQPAARRASRRSPV